MSGPVSPITDRDFESIKNTMLNMKIPELKRICRCLDLSQSGRKADLQHRISSFLSKAKVNDAQSQMYAIKEIVQAVKDLQSVPDYGSLLKHYEARLRGARERPRNNTMRVIHVEEHHADFNFI
ncbi:unnamed protein product [Ambrosiozyma monospora]|uniref:Unnamed protein product n=1 Tax=Ambrosiozyma monospora TaxID=43982 RepID=A0ACB5T9H4_AMBMO|nr:unnamed protein product [Ambrosiozyma monospora]